MPEQHPRPPVVLEEPSVREMDKSIQYARESGGLPDAPEEDPVRERNPFRPKRGG